MSYSRFELRASLLLFFLAFGCSILGAEASSAEAERGELRSWAIGPGRIRKAYDALPRSDGGLWMVASPMRKEGGGRTPAELSRWAAGGRLLWARTIVDSLPIDIRFHLVAEPGGEVVVAGQSGGALRMWRFSEAGDLLWGQQLATDPTNPDELVAANGKGGLYVALRLPPSRRGRSDQPEIAAGEARIFHYSEKGVLLQSYSLQAVPEERQPGERWLPSGALGIQNPIAIAASPAGGIAVVGYFAGLSAVAPSPGQGVPKERLDYGWLSSGGGGMPQVKIFVDRWDESGRRLWSRLFGSMWNNLAFAVASAKNGAVAIAGSSEWGACPDGRPLRPAGLRLFVAEYGVDPAASPGWCREVERNLSIGPMAIGYDVDGGLWLIGEAKGPLVSGEPLSQGGRVFLAKLDPAGRVQWKRQVGEGTSRPFAHIAFGPEDHPTVAWSTAALGSLHRSQEGETVSVALLPQGLP